MSRAGARSPNVRAVKQAKPSLDEARHIVDAGLDLYAGDDDLVLPFLEVGGTGGICVHTHVVGPQVEGAGRGASAPATSSGARALDRELAPAIELLRVVRRTRSRSSRALNLLGHDVGGLRLPLVEATRRESARGPRLPRARSGLLRRRR